MNDYRVEFYWTNSRGTQKTAMAIVQSSGESAAIKAGRAEISADYGLSRLRLKSVRIFNG